MESKSSRCESQSGPFARQRKPTSRTSCLSMQCSTSVLFRKTSKLAPMSRCRPVSECPTTAGTSEPLQAADPRAPVDNHSHEGDQWHPQPRRACRSFQSSFSNRIGEFFVLRHPLMASVPDCGLLQCGLTNVEFVSAAY
jgi:hypothetical protein